MLTFEGLAGEHAYYFRSIQKRAEVFREILKVLPNKVASYDDDIDLAATDIFSLEPSDVILAVYEGKYLFK